MPIKQLRTGMQVFGGVLSRLPSRDSLWRLMRNFQLASVHISPTAET